MFCQDALLVNNKGATATASVLYCRSWFCPVCRRKRFRQLTHLCRDGEPTTFITLTVNPAIGDSPADRACRLKKAWTNLRREIVRHGYAEKVPFVAVFETTEAGEPHLHILARLPYVPQKWLSEKMRGYIDAPIVDIRRVRSKRGVARYVAKYVSKAPEQFSGCKRYWTSLDWTPRNEAAPVIERSKEGEWYRTHATLESWCDIWRYAGWRVERDGDRAVAVRQGPPP